MPSIVDEMLNNPNFHEVILEDAIVMVATFQTEFPNEILAGTFGKAAIQALLDQDNCIGIRHYFARNTDSNDLTLVLVGVDSDLNNIMDRLSENSIPFESE